MRQAAAKASGLYAALICVRSVWADFLRAKAYNNPPGASNRKEPGMAEIESRKYSDEHRNKARVDAGKFNQPTQFHPDRTGVQKNDNNGKRK